MTQHDPLTWKPTDIVEVTNISDQNLSLELQSGPLRLDVGRVYRLTSSALEQPQVRALLERGLIKVESVPKK